MEIWIPEKNEIENIIEKVLIKLRNAEKVSDVAEWIEDEFSTLECHISNRARIETK
jgi:hypothetical protein